MNNQIHIRLSVAEVQSLIDAVSYSSSLSKTHKQLEVKLNKQLKEQQHASNRCDCCAELWSVCHCNCYNCGDMYRDCRLNCLE